jgi:hypothetical protein
MRFPFSLARKLMRGRVLARSSAITGVTAAVLIALFITLKAFALSGPQVVERDLGRFDWKADLSAAAGLTPGNAGLADKIAAAARGAGAGDAVVSVTSLDIRPAVVDPPVTKYLEADWSASPFPERFALVAGRWPTEPGEVVLSGPSWSDADTVSVLAGNHAFRVVGTADDRYSDWDLFLAAPGTFAGIDTAGVTGYPTLYWGEQADRDRVVAAVGAVLGMRTGDLEQGIVSRRTVIEAGTQSWVERFPLAYRIPALALPLLSVLTIVGLTRRRSTRTVEVLVSLGISRFRAVAGVGSATVAWTMISTLLGVPAGIGLGLVVRPITQRWRVEPPHGLPSLWSPVAQLLLVTAAACLLAVAALRPWRTVSAEAVTLVRRCAAIMACGVLVFQAVGLDTTVKAMVFTGFAGVAVLLASPDLIGAVLRWLPTSGARLRLGRQRLLHDRSRAVAAVAVLTAVLAAPIALLTFLATEVATQEAKYVPEVGAHQVVLSGVGGPTQAPPPEAVAAVTGRVRFAAPPIRLHFTGGVLVVDTPEEVGRLANRLLTSAETETLRRGDALAPAAFHHVWQAFDQGVLLTSAARDLRLPVTDGGIVFTDVPDTDAAAARQAILDARLDHGLIGVHQPPEPAFVPTTFYAAVLGLVAVALLTTMAVARSQVGTLRTYLGRLLAIGLPTRWARQVLAVEIAVVVGVSTLLALAIAIPSLVLAAYRIDSLTLRVPWPHLGVLLATFYLATACATAISSRRLRIRP